MNSVLLSTLAPNSVFQTIATGAHAVPIVYTTDIVPYFNTPLRTCIRRDQMEPLQLPANLEVLPGGTIPFFQSGQGGPNNDE